MDLTIFSLPYVCSYSSSREDTLEEATYIKNNVKIYIWQVSSLKMTTTEVLANVHTKQMFVDVLHHEKTHLKKRNVLNTTLECT